MTLRMAVELVVACEAPISRDGLYAQVCGLMGRTVLEERVGEELMRLHRGRRVILRGSTANPMVLIAT